jgi:hypothetical protein
LRITEGKYSDIKIKLFIEITGSSPFLNAVEDDSTALAALTDLCNLAQLKSSTFVAFVCFCFFFPMPAFSEQPKFSTAARKIREYVHKETLKKLKWIIKKSEKPMEVREKATELLLRLSQRGILFVFHFSVFRLDQLNFLLFFLFFRR